MNISNKNDNILTKINNLIYPVYFGDEFNQITEIKNPHSTKSEDIIFFEGFLLSCISLMFLHLILFMFSVMLLLAIAQVTQDDPAKIFAFMCIFAFPTFLLNLKTNNSLRKKLNEKEYRWVEVNHERLGLPSPNTSMTRRELIPYVEKAYEYERKNGILMQN